MNIALGVSASGVEWGQTDTSRTCSNINMHERSSHLKVNLPPIMSVSLWTTRSYITSQCSYASFQTKDEITMMEIMFVFKLQLEGKFHYAVYAKH